MFTGLIQEIGTVLDIKEHETSIELQLSLGSLATQIALGDSVSVDGVCLTVRGISSDAVSFDVMKQTLLLTNMKTLKKGSRVNLELAVLPTQRLGGHLVQGHVDGVGSVLLREPGDRWERFVISIPEKLLKYIVAQGSITVNGVSLTVGSIDDDKAEIELWLIPETLSKTVFGSSHVDDLLNIEVDVLGKYVERLLAKGDVKS